MPTMGILCILGKVYYYVIYIKSGNHLDHHIVSLITLSDLLALKRAIKLQNASVSITECGLALDIMLVCIVLIICK